MTTNPQTSTLQTVRHVIDGQLNFSAHGHELGPDDDLWALGMTSLTCVGLMLALENTFEVELPDQLLAESTFRSANAIATAIETVLPARQ